MSSLTFLFLATTAGNIVAVDDFESLVSPAQQSSSLASLPSLQQQAIEESLSLVAKTSLNINITQHFVRMLATLWSVIVGIIFLRFFLVM
jgi:hypothetical protein